jgi:hypothetical protein
MSGGNASTRSSLTTGVHGAYLRHSVHDEKLDSGPRRRELRHLNPPAEIKIEEQEDLVRDAN